MKEQHTEKSGLCAKGLGQGPETWLGQQLSATKMSIVLEKTMMFWSGFWSGWFSSLSSHLLLPETGFGTVGHCLLLPLLWISPLSWEMGIQDAYLRAEEHTDVGGTEEVRRAD